jgi:Tol biopolymer transport system component
MRLLLAFLLILAAVLALGAGCGGDDASSDIAFVSSRDGDYAIFTMSADGSSERRLTEADGDGANDGSPFFQIDPAWSPDGSKIAFASGRTGTSDIYVMNADGTQTRRLTSTDQNDAHPTWSADGRTLAFTRGGDIYEMSADGSSPRRISDVLVEESDPAWSPDGEWVAYVRRTPGTAVQEVWVMRPDGSERHALTRQNGSAFTPAWAPDGTRIAFSTNAESEVYELFTIGLDGKGLRQVAPTAGDNFEPSWSPDGTKIAYQEAGGIFTVELGGGGEVERLTDSANNDSSPVWNPRPPGPDE